jgi:hypothetical protein
MSWVAVAVGAGSVVTGYLGSQSASKASKASQQGSEAAIAEQRRQFDLVRSDTAGTRHIGQGATDLLSRLYGYGAAPRGTGFGAGATPYNAPAIGDDGFFNTGAGKVLNPWSVTSQLGGAGKILDPAGGLFGNIFGNKHGDEKRNLKAFTEQNEIYDLGNGMLGLADGTTFRKDQLQDVAGAWYGATYAPDGDQAGWQQRYGGLITKPAAPAQQTGATTGAAAPAGRPDMSAFFESPDYQFNLQEGQKGLDRSLAARGGALSGGGVREGIRYASGMASREYGSFVDRLMQQAGLGNTGIGASAAAGASAASNIGNAYMNAGNARASGYLQQGQAINNAVQGGTQNLLLYKYLNG